jgi:glutamate synthase domain-containing protein 3
MGMTAFDVWGERKKVEAFDPMTAIERKEGCVIIHADRRDGNGRLIHYKVLNELVRQIMLEGEKRIVLDGVMGHRYIASTANRKDLYIEIHGTPGNNLGAFLDGPTIEVYGNAQDLTGNTMNSGKIIVHGNAWDVTGLAARGGTLLIKGNTGYRVGIHMKEYGGTKPAMVIGGTSKDYLGEYMAGGTIVVLDQGGQIDRSPVGMHLGAGIHGGRIFIRGKVEKHQLGPGAVMNQVCGEDAPELEALISQFEQTFKTSVPRDWERWVRISPASSRPFSGHYDPTSV